MVVTASTSKQTARTSSSIREIRRGQEEGHGIAGMIRKEVKSRSFGALFAVPLAAAVFMGSSSLSDAQSIPRIDSIKPVGGTNLEFNISQLDAGVTCVIAAKSGIVGNQLSDYYDI